VIYLRWQEYPAWSACAGRPALQESEGGVEDEIPRLTPDIKADLNERKAAIDGAVSVEILPLQSLDVGAITGERGATAWANVLLVEYADHAALEVYPADKILALAALVKYSTLHLITNTNVGTPEELLVFGQQVTEAASLSLNLRQSVTALEHLVPGDYCRSCLSAYRCPKLTADIHEEVFGPLQPLEDPDAVPVEPEYDHLHMVRAKLPLIEAWLLQVKQRLGLLDRKPAQRARRRKKAKKRARDLN